MYIDYIIPDHDFCSTVNVAYAQYNCPHQQSYVLYNIHRRYKSQARRSSSKIWAANWFRQIFYKTDTSLYLS